MRKQNPNDVIDGFQRELAESLATWQHLRERVGVSGDLAKRVSVDAFQRAAVTFENFRSDWHIAAVNRDSTVFKAHFTTKVEQSVGSRWKGLANRVSIELPMHPSLEVVREILDPDGENVSLGSYKIWRERAQEHLTAPYASPLVKLPIQDQKLIDGVIAIRNLLSHRSQRSSNAMNDALRKLHGRHDPDLRRGTKRIEPSGIGSYLNADRNGARRVEIFYVRLEGISDQLRTA